jgi:hypothetical protein
MPDIEMTNEIIENRTIIRKRVAETILEEVIGVMGLRQKPWARPLFGPLLRIPIRRMTDTLVDVDENIAQLGLSAAIERQLGGFVAEYRVSGSVTVPKEGPLLIACNHPGSYDMPILSTVMKRDDLKTVASNITVFRQLPNIMEHFILISRDPHVRMVTVRNCLRHLSEGGALLIFPRGEVEPDRSVIPGSLPDFENWSPSLELFLRKVPSTRVLAVFASGVLSPRWFNSRFVRMWKKPAQRQKVSEIFQVIQQLVGSKNLSLHPRVAFSPLLTVDDLGTIQAPNGDLLKAIIQQARLLVEADSD